MFNKNKNVITMLVVFAFVMLFSKNVRAESVAFNKPVTGTIRGSQRVVYDVYMPERGYVYCNVEVVRAGFDDGTNTKDGHVWMAMIIDDR